MELYGRESGYGWTMGEVVAAQMVYVPVSEAFRSDPWRAYWVIGGLAGIFVALVVGLVVVVGRT